tara:strand:+ start:279 stop:407 length:129 start_codon:yes stop_codon:yes gene_type:complete
VILTDLGGSAAALVYAFTELRGFRAEGTLTAIRITEPGGESV